MTWKKYRRLGVAEMTEWDKDMDMTNISVSDADIKNGSPKPGDMIARNPKNHNDKWLVAEKYFKSSFEVVKG